MRNNHYVVDTAMCSNKHARRVFCLTTPNIPVNFAGQRSQHRKPCDRQSQNGANGPRPDAITNEYEQRDLAKYKISILENSMTGDQ